MRTRMNHIIKIFAYVVGVLTFVNLNQEITAQPVKSNSLEHQVFYHVFLRSFYDSNGDGHGDLNGLKQKLDYLQVLGVTSVLLTPLYHSDFYHNYFPIDFEEIDPEFGTKEDYFALLKDMHQRSMKLYMDMEIHYVTEDHLWYKDSHQNPSSQYSEYIIYNGPNNTDPEPIIFNLTAVNSYDGKVIKCCTIDLYHQNVRDYVYNLFKYWVDPDQDGNFDDGIDGFRIDHIMDDLDWKGKITGLLNYFWKPLFQQLREINPEITIIGEQADWSYGGDYFSKADLNAVFAFPLSQAIRKFDFNHIENKVDSTHKVTPENKYQLIFIENHDMPRIATVLQSEVPKLKVSAALNLLLKGAPIIYYGQEIGMIGANGFGKFGSTDGNDIPVREAFEWYKAVEGQGMAMWYKNTGPWWDQTQLKNNDGISLEEQKADPNSLWKFYKALLALRNTNSAIQTGSFQFLDNDNDQVLSFSRWDDSQAILVLINLNDKEATVSLEILKFPMALDEPRILNLLKPSGTKSIEINKQTITAKLTNFDVQVWRIR